MLSVTKKNSFIFFPINARSECVSPLKGHEGYLHDISYDESSKMLASASEDGTVRIWDLRNPKGKAQGCYSIFKLAANQKLQIIILTHIYDISILKTEIKIAGKINCFFDHLGLFSLVHICSNYPPRS